MLFDCLGDACDDLCVDPNKVIPAHARFSGNAGCDDDNVRAGNVPIIGCARKGSVKAVNWRGLRDVQGFALGHAFHDVKEDDVAEIFQAGQVSKCAPDIAGTDKYNFFTRHIE